ncbi:ATP-binding protein [Ancylobacter oerskovii]|uniref:ATP-binding protein n=1 Tax=Ancylobacter oerskovii TaxID=459519 RepID=A0ABW4Z5I7_9HYPH
MCCRGLSTTGFDPYPRCRAPRRLPSRAREAPAISDRPGLDRTEVINLLGPPGTGKSHLATALTVEAVKVGCSVAFSTPRTSSPRSKGREGRVVRKRIRYLCRARC